MDKTGNLTLKCTAIGSLPHKNIDDAINLIKKDFSNIPFWPQMVKINKNEDMIFQFIENMPSFFSDENRIYLNTEYDNFFEDLEEFFNDYEAITNNIQSYNIEKYKITKAIAFEKYLKLLIDNHPQYAKGQIVGPFTLSTSLFTKDGTAAIYDDTLKEIITKNLTLKALWQIYQIKKASPNTIPIIFIDEPTLSQLGTSAYMSLTESGIISMIKEITKAIKYNNAIPAIHCCGKCNWRVPLKSEVEIINFDAYSYAENISIFSNEIDKFLHKNGKIAWGIVPTLDKKALEKITIEDLVEKFEIAVKYLTNKGIDEKLIIRNSLITPSCGAGILPVELAEKAMDLTSLLSTKLKEKYQLDS